MSENTLSLTTSASEVTVFENDQFGSIRTIIRDGEPWFVGADVCRALELDDTHKAVERLDDDEKGRSSIPTPGGAQELLVVNEPGLYALVLGSRKPEAKAFRRWITHEVIPTIRKHGGYLTPQAIEQFLDNPDLIVEMALKMKAEREKCEMLESELLAAKPKVEYFNDLVDRETLTGIRETAKELDWSERNFTRYLVDNGFAYRDQKSRLQPYAKHVEDGLFVLKECKSNRNPWSGTQMMITPKGRETLRLLRCG